MTSGADVERAATALAEGRWDAARTGFEAALRRVESADALMGLADALFWLGDGSGCLRRLERAYALLRRDGRAEEAAMAAVWLAVLSRRTLANEPASLGWVARAARLVEEVEGDAMAGWVAWARAVTARAPERVAALAREALGAARTGDDPDLELCALGELGSALVALGRVEEGLTLVDEAMAATLAGEYRNRDTVPAATCSMLRACDGAADLARVRDWCRMADGFMRTYGCPFLFADCRMRYGRVLFATGQWADAERELLAAARVAPPDSDYHAAAVACLAELRVRQGRTEEAAALLQPLGGAPAVRLAVAAVHHARGEHEAAAATLERGLDECGHEDPDACPALALLVDARLSVGDRAGAVSAARSLADATSGRGDRQAAHRESASGRVAAADGDAGSAIAFLGRAEDLFRRAGLPYEAACARLGLAEARAVAAPEAATADAGSAWAALDRLGALPAAGAAADLLRRLGAARPSGPRDADVLTKREREVLRLLGDGLSNPEIADRLVISRKTASHHVSNLLAKLGLRNRSEAAAYAVRSALGEDRPAPGPSGLTDAGPGARSPRGRGER